MGCVLSTRVYTPLLCRRSIISPVRYRSERLTLFVPALREIVTFDKIIFENQISRLIRRILKGPLVSNAKLS